jgi:hypothetical protein
VELLLVCKPDIHSTPLTFWWCHIMTSWMSIPVFSRCRRYSTTDEHHIRLEVLIVYNRSTSSLCLNISSHEHKTLSGLLR